MSVMTIGQFIVAMNKQNKTAKETLALVGRVYPGCQTSLKSIYSTLSVAGLSSVKKIVVDMEAYNLAMGIKPVEQKKTGTEGE